MARVTVEDCVDKVPNRFELVLLAAHRARALSSGAPITVQRENDRNPVIAAREIRGQTVSTQDLMEDLIHSMRAYVGVDEPEADAVLALPESRPGSYFGQGDPSTDTVVERITEEELLQGLACSIPSEASGSR